MTPDELRERLERFIARAAAVDTVRVEGLRKLPGGASRQIWSLDAVYNEHGAEVRLPLVLRRDPGSTTLNTQRREEFAVQMAAFAEDVPVPRPYWLAEDGEVLGAPSYLMQRVEGETLARRLLRDDEYAHARQVMTAQLGAILARIHRVDLDHHRLDFLPAPPAGESPAPAEIDRYEQIFRGVAPEPHPAFELAFRWLRQHLPAVGPRRLVHGDYRIGNVIFGPEGVRAILDWELAHIGDPAEDLGWLCVRAWRFGSDAKPAGGIGTRDELLAAYERAGGAPVDAERVRFWEIFGNLKWAIICIVQAKTHLDGLVRSVELAAIGRRTAETEIELLNLISESAHS
jgi:aminoglycoside phosphotransferase (APT) family kinase protein